MKSQILNRWTGSVICESNSLSIRELIFANLSDANLSDADLSDADLSDADLSDADLSGADLSGANLSDADLSGANLRRANLRRANLRRADLSGANLRRANLRRANLRRANLRRADLSGADLSDADLSGANLSGCTGLKYACDYLSTFEQDDLGIIVYKRIGNGLTEYPIPSTWTIAPGSFITENPNPSRGSNCGCGVNFGTLDWTQRNYTGADLWKCRIRFVDVADVVVPYRTDGKARCRRLELIEVVK